MTAPAPSYSVPRRADRLIPPAAGRNASDVDGNAGVAVVGQKLMYTIDEVVEQTGICRTKLYAEMKSGRLRYAQYGDKRLIRPEWVDQFVDLICTESGREN